VTAEEVGRCAGRGREREERPLVQDRGVTEERTKPKPSSRLASEGRQTRSDSPSAAMARIEGARGPRYGAETIGCHEENEGRGILIIPQQSTSTQAKRAAQQ
jgi:hypothetical protein